MGHSAAQIDAQLSYSVVETWAINLFKYAGNCGGRTFLSAFIVCAFINTTYYTLIVKKIEVQAAVLTTYGYDYVTVFQKPRLATDCFLSRDIEDKRGLH